MYTSCTPPCTPHVHLVYTSYTPPYTPHVHHPSTFDLKSCDPKPETRNPTGLPGDNCGVMRGPSTLNPKTPSTLNPQPSALYPQPSTLNPQPSTLKHQPSTLNLTTRSGTFMAKTTKGLVSLPTRLRQVSGNSSTRTSGTRCLGFRVSGRRA